MSEIRRFGHGTNNYSIKMKPIEKHTKTRSLNISANGEKKILRSIKEWERKRLYKDQNYNIDRFSKDLGINRKYLSSVINDHYGVNFSSYVNNLRIQFMQEVINDLNSVSDLNLTSLARLSGFSSYFKFSHYVKNTFGRSPRDFFISKLTKEQ